MECSLEYKYENKVFYPSDSLSFNYFIYPTLTPDNLKGIFTAEPHGLAIDKETGKVDVQNSEGGTAYDITFTADNNKAKCSTSITIGGIDYQDGIYNLNKNQDTAAPFFNGNVDVTPPNGSYGIDTQGQVPAGAINNVNGEINLRQIVLGGGLGSDPGKAPKNGTSRDFFISYSFLEPVQRDNVFGSLTLRVYYFETEADIPASLLRELEEKQQYPKGGRVGKTEDHRPPSAVVISR